MSGFGGDFKSNHVTNTESQVDDSLSESLSILNQEAIESAPTAFITNQNKGIGIVKNIRKPNTFFSKRSISNIKKKPTPTET